MNQVEYDKSVMIKVASFLSCSSRRAAELEKLHSNSNVEGLYLRENLNIDKADRNFFDVSMRFRKALDLIVLHKGTPIEKDPLVDLVALGNKDSVGYKLCKEGRSDTLKALSLMIDGGEIKNKSVEGILLMYMLWKNGVNGVRTIFEEFNQQRTVLGSTEISEFVEGSKEETMYEYIKENWWERNKSKMSLDDFIHYRASRVALDSVSSIIHSEMRISDPGLDFMFLCMGLYEVQILNGTDTLKDLISWTISRREFNSLISRLTERTSGFSKVTMMQLVPVALWARAFQDRMGVGNAYAYKLFQRKSKVDSSIKSPSLEVDSTVKEMEQVIASLETVGKSKDETIRILSKREKEQDGKIAAQQEEIELLKKFINQMDELEQEGELTFSNGFSRTSTEEAVAYFSRFKIALVGGHPNFRDKLLEYFPSLVHFPVKEKVNYPVDKLANSDIVMFHKSHVAHKSFFRMYKVIDSRGLPIISLPANVNMDIVLDVAYGKAKKLEESGKLLV